LESKRQSTPNDELVKLFHFEAIAVNFFVFSNLAAIEKRFWARGFLKLLNQNTTCGVMSKPEAHEEKQGFESLIDVIREKYSLSYGMKSSIVPRIQTVAR
jgi:hypothetical protein